MRIWQCHVLFFLSPTFQVTIDDYLGGKVMKKTLVAAVLILLSFSFFASAQEATEEPEEVIVARPGQQVNMVLLPKFLGITPFEQAYSGAQEAHEELGNPGNLAFLGPSPENSIAGQIEIIEQSTEQGVNAIMISANSLTDLLPATQAAMEEGVTIVTWDSPVAPEGETLFIAQVDFSETGKVMADMALSILGEDGGQFAILSASE
ncbi:MAG: substrate-binding domain-containing protein, partial [Anaerolineae bacterium]|nr:substrate-binding domain-containing protein [Anaerolineae bacterium]